MDRFTTAEDEFLIHYVEEHPELFDLERRDYRDMLLKEKVWSEIGTALKKRGEDCKKRWRCIKDTYFKNKKKLGTGSAAREKSVKWHLFKHLTFLDNVRHERQSTNTMVLGTLDDNSDHSELDSQPVLDESPSASYISDRDTANLNQSSSNESSSAFKRPRIRYDALERRAEERLQIIKKALLEEDDHVDHFMKSIAKSVKALPPELISEAKLGILTLVTNLEQRSRAPPLYPPSYPPSYPQNDEYFNM